MPINQEPSKPAPKPTPKAQPRLDDEPQVIVRGRVSHVEFSVDQPEPMPVRPPKHKKP